MKHIPLSIIILLSLLLSSCAASDPSADTDTASEELYADVTLPPLVTTPGASLEGSDFDMFGDYVADVVTDVCPDDPRPVTLTKTTASDTDGFVDLSEYIQVDDAGLLYVKRPPEPETEPPETEAPETDENGEIVPAPDGDETTEAETTAEPETTEPETTELDLSGLPVFCVIKKDVKTLDRALYASLEFDAFAVESGSTSFCARFGSLFDPSGETMLLYPINSAAQEYEMPPHTRVIGESALEGAANLTAVYPAAELEYVSRRAFAGCVSLERITLGDSTVYVGEEAFDGCTALTRLVIGSSLVSMGSHVCRGCVSLSELDIHNADFHTLRRSDGEIPFSDTPWYNDSDSEFLLAGGLLVRYIPQDDGGETYIDYTVRWIPSWAVSGSGPRKLYMSRDVFILEYDGWDASIEIVYI